jgi:hypothetical protein
VFGSPVRFRGPGFELFVRVGLGVFAGIAHDFPKWIAAGIFPD